MRSVKRQSWSKERPPQFQNRQQNFHSVRRHHDPPPQNTGRRRRRRQASRQKPPSPAGEKAPFPEATQRQRSNQSGDLGLQGKSGRSPCRPPTRSTNPCLGRQPRRGTPQPASQPHLSTAPRPSSESRVRQLPSAPGPSLGGKRQPSPGTAGAPLASPQETVEKAQPGPERRRRGQRLLCYGGGGN